MVGGIAPGSRSVSIRDGVGPRPRGAWPERVSVEGKRVRTAFRVRYAETDQMGMAYYAGYLVWFEVLRGDLMRTAGIPYTRLEAQGYFLPIVEAHLRYLSPAPDGPWSCGGSGAAIPPGAIRIPPGAGREAPRRGVDDPRSHGAGWAPQGVFPGTSGGPWALDRGGRGIPVTCPPLCYTPLRRMGFFQEA
jgi:hypothetical protein